MDIQEELKKIKDYIIKNYKVYKCEITNECRHWNAVRFYSKSKNEFSIHIGEPSKTSFAPDNYLVHYGREMTKDRCGMGGARIYESNKLCEVIDKIMIHILSFQKEKAVQESLF